MFIYKLYKIYIHIYKVYYNMYTYIYIFNRNISLSSFGYRETTVIDKYDADLEHS